MAESLPSQIANLLLLLGEWALAGGELVAAVLTPFLVRLAPPVFFAFLVFTSKPSRFFTSSITNVPGSFVEIDEGDMCSPFEAPYQRSAVSCSAARNGSRGCCFDFSASFLLVPESSEDGFMAAIISPNVEQV